MVQLSWTVSGGTGPYSFAWTPTPPVGDGTSSISGLCAGLWTVLVTDDNGCEITAQFTVSDPVPLDGQLSITDPTCGNVCDGSVYHKCVWRISAVHVLVESCSTYGARNR